MKHLFSPWNKKIDVPTQEAVSKIDIESAKDLLEYFLDLDYADSKLYSYEEDGQEVVDSIGAIGLDFWFCGQKGELLGNIGILEDGRIKPWYYRNTESSDNSVIGYRVFIQCNERYEKIPDEIVNDLRNKIKLITSSLNFDFYSLQITNYNWDKYKSNYLFSRDFEDIQKYDGDFLSCGLIFTLNI